MVAPPPGGGGVGVMSNIFGRAVVVREDGRRWWAKAARVRGTGARRYALGGGGRCTDIPGGGCPTFGRRGLRVCWGMFTGVVGDNDRIVEGGTFYYQGLW